MIYVRHNISGCAPYIQPTSIAFYDLTILLDGRLEYNIDGTEILLESGDAILIPPGSLRSRRKSEITADYISFNFITDSSVKIPLVQKKAVRRELVLLIDAYDRIEKCVYPDNKEKNEYLCGCLLALLEDISSESATNPLIRKIIEYIHSDISRKITLQDIGNLTFFSPIYCDAVFKKETGKSIIDYVIDRRIDEAKKLLLEGGLSLSQVSEEVGFADYNYFSRVFKKRSGYTPTAYRRITFSKMNL